MGVDVDVDVGEQQQQRACVVCPVGVGVGGCVYVLSWLGGREYWRAVVGQRVKGGVQWVE